MTSFLFVFLSIKEDPIDDKKKRWRWGRTTRGWDEGEEKERDFEDAWKMLEFA